MTQNTWTEKVLLAAKEKSKLVDAKRAKKVLKSVRYDEGLLIQVQKIAQREGFPYQTLMNSLLKSGLELRQVNLIER